MQRKRQSKDVEWIVRNDLDDIYPSNGPQLAVLMDIRDELKTLRKELREVFLMLARKMK